MFAAHRLRVLITMLGIVLLSTAMMGSNGHVDAQSVQPGIALQDLGALDVTGPDWSFVGDFQISAGAWESVTISNYGYCFVGPKDPRAGTAHAAAVFWFAELEKFPLDASGYSFRGNLKAGRGGNVSGQVRVTSTDGIKPLTHVEATLSGGDLTYFQNNSLEVCLLGSS